MPGPGPRPGVRALTRRAGGATTVDCFERRTCFGAGFATAGAAGTDVFGADFFGPDVGGVEFTGADFFGAGCC